jgi:hypothetical protein
LIGNQRQSALRRSARPADSTATAFYPTVLTVVGSYYVLFARWRSVALFDADWRHGGLTAIAEGAAGTNGRGPAAHGVFDSLTPQSRERARVVAAFCLAFDVTAAAYFACLLTFGRVAAHPVPGSPTSTSGAHSND